MALKQLNEKEQKELVKQCQEEIENAKTFMGPKWAKWRKRLKLLNNQKKNEADISDPLAHTHFNTLLAALYDDELVTTFLPREQGDVNNAQNLNPLYEYDSELMSMDTMNYQWLWNALFFGRSLVMMFEWDSEMSVPVPEVVNMLTWYRDPNAKSVNGDTAGRGAMRFGGRPILLTKKQMEDAGVYENIDKITPNTAENDILTAAGDEVRNAQGLGGSVSDDITTENRLLTSMEWFTIYKGKRIAVGLANGDTLLTRYTELKDQNKWGIIDRVIFPDGIDWDGVSVMDLIEDKQRARARIINAALFNTEVNGNHMYAYDTNKITSESDLDFGQNRHVPVDGDPTNAIQAIQRTQIANETDYMLNWLEKSAGRATGATEIEQGVATGGRKTATEIATLSESVDTRFNLMAKVITWSTRRFAQYWYKMYKMYFTTEIQDKFLRIVGPDAIFFKKFDKEQVITNIDPDVSVKSKIVGEARRLRKLQEWNAEAEIMYADPSVDKEYMTRERARLGGATEMEMLSRFKPDPERIIAMEENKQLEKNEYVDLNETDNDIKHIEEHRKAASTKKNLAHQKAHMEQFIVKNKNPNVKEEAQALLPPEPAGMPNLQPDLDTPKMLQTA